jgi:hypothetical protein
VPSSAFSRLNFTTLATAVAMLLPQFLPAAQFALASGAILKEFRIKEGAYFFPVKRP